jgi:hypothetical protein
MCGQFFRLQTADQNRSGVSTLIFNYLELTRITKLFLTILLIYAGFYIIPNEDFCAYAQTMVQNIAPADAQPFSKQLTQFLKGMTEAPEDEYLRIFGRYGEVIAKELNLDKLYFVSYPEVENLLDQAVKESMDSLTLFTHPRLQNPKGFAIVFKKELLQQINKNFNFHGLFNISVPSVNDGSAVNMNFFVVGQGKFIVGYNRNAKIKHPDYDFVTGYYDYHELFIMDAKKDSKGNSGLFNIKGLTNPNEEPKWMKGPLNVDIQSLVISSDKGNQRQIIIQYDLFGIKNKILKPIPIEKLTDG